MLIVMKSNDWYFKGFRICSRVPRFDPNMVHCEGIKGGLVALLVGTMSKKEDINEPLLSLIFVLQHN